jgi:hypothetical protein
MRRAPFRALGGSKSIPYERVNRQAGLVAGQCQGAAYLRRYVVVVDDEIDAYDINDVLWAMCNRADPGCATTGVEKATRARVLGTRAPRDLPTDVKPRCLRRSNCRPRH